MSNQLTIPLIAKDDKNGDEFFIGSVDIPAAVDLSRATFLFFLPSKGSDVGHLKIRMRDAAKPRRHEDESY